MSNNGDSKSTARLFMDGNIRDSFISDIGGKCGNETSPAKFSFNETTDDKNVTTQIHVFPTELSTFLKNDSSCKSDTLSAVFNYENFIKQVPYIEVRAFMPDTIIQFMMDFFETIKNAGVYVSENSSDQIFEDMANAFNTTADNVKYFLNGLFSSNGRDIFTKTLSKKFSENMYFRNNNRKDYDFSILDLPWNLYYRLLGSTTNAVYKIPCQFPSNFLNSDGSYGWSNAGMHTFQNFKKNKKDNNSKNKNESTNESNVELKSESSSLINKGFDFLLNRIAQKTGIPIMPFFSPGNSSNSPNMSFSITFDLINDTFDHAKDNFAFIQTLIANNKWIQYLFFTNPSNLYDVKIPGGYRLFMCTGDFSVTYKGVVKKSKKPIGIFENETRIPEVYSVNMTFTSLLPDNFNTHMMGILKTNENIMEIVNNNDGKPTRKSNGVAGNIGNMMSSAITNVTEFEKGKDPDAHKEEYKKYLENIKDLIDKIKTFSPEKRSEFLENIYQDESVILAKIEEEYRNLIFTKLNELSGEEASSYTLPEDITKKLYEKAVDNVFTELTQNYEIQYKAVEEAQNKALEEAQKNEQNNEN